MEDSTAFTRTTEHHIPVLGPKDVLSDEARKIVQWACFGVVGQFIAIFGIVTNIMNIICFVNQGFKEAINISLLGLSISDLCSLVTVVWSNIGCNPAFNEIDWWFDPVELQHMTGSWPHVTFARVTSWITAFITLERCLCVTMPLKIKTVITPLRATIIIISIYIVVIVSASPVYFVSRFGMKVSAARNKTILGLIYTDDLAQVEKISFITNVLIISFGAFLTVIISTTSLVVKLKLKSTWRENSTSSIQCKDLSRRDLKVARMVTMISALFIACFLPICALVIAVLTVPQLSLDGLYRNTLIAMVSVTFVMESTNSAMNVFIYYRMSTRYRAVFRQVILCQKSNP